MRKVSQLRKSRLWVLLNNLSEVCQMMIYVFRQMKGRLFDDDSFRSRPICKGEIVRFIQHRLKIMLVTCIYVNRKVLFLQLALY